MKNRIVGIFIAIFFGGFVTTVANAQDLLGSYNVGDGVYWVDNPPTYNCLEACAEVLGGAPGDYSCSTTDQSINNQAFVDGWGDSQYCTTPVSETFKLNDSYNCGSSQCSYSAYVDDHGPCTNATNYCFAAGGAGGGGAPAAVAEPIPVMGGWGIALLSLLTVIGGAIGLKRQRFSRKK